MSYWLVTLVFLYYLCDDEVLNYDLQYIMTCKLPHELYVNEIDKFIYYYLIFSKYTDAIPITYEHEYKLSVSRQRLETRCADR